ncbi:MULTISPECIES: agmatinase [unclassified Rhodococcus (in: high G+C Gram-positive bacteria)]|uniref:agmatinase n=1 Tax=unclassified Rhodococcus (in: high G+C Gram-positive bacteria) TaxID=192944 RepID=UPI0016397F5A|nr:MULTISPECIES: agmatinase [unclassified Rhodococcus (in: high G+C Gram-positive bacteria)]MBC2644168.1 agmatinase [Rhodococcus sp. 3A]MBC2891093.1 agmatinase [Rhodococcus sp. 4CII]
MTSPRIEPVGPISGQDLPRYAGYSTFARLPRADEVSHVGVGILGVPFDAGVTYRPGARFGPGHIRQASRVLRPYNPELGVDPFRSMQVADCGDVGCNPFAIGEALGQIERAADSHLSVGTRLVVLGGDHTVALPVLRSIAKQYGPVAVVHFDAHLDTWDTYFGEAYTHGTPFRRASEEGLIDRQASVHIGTRGPIYSAVDLSMDRELGFIPIHAREFTRTPLDRIIDRVLERVGSRPVYVSVDIDVLDPAHAPGTGTPEPGGLTSRELLEMIRSFSQARLVSADIVEVSPAYDHAEITALAASSVAYELLSVMACTPR